MLWPETPCSLFFSHVSWAQPFKDSVFTLGIAFNAEHCFPEKLIPGKHVGLVTRKSNTAGKITLRVAVIALQPKPRCIAHATWKIFEGSTNYPFLLFLTAQDLWWLFFTLFCHSVEQHRREWSGGRGWPCLWDLARAGGFGAQVPAAGANREHQELLGEGDSGHPAADQRAHLE